LARSLHFIAGPVQNTGAESSARPLHFIAGPVQNTGAESLARPLHFIAGPVQNTGAESSARPLHFIAGLVQNTGAESLARPIHFIAGPVQNTGAGSSAGPLHFIAGPVQNTGAESSVRPLHFIAGLPKIQELSHRHDYSTCCLVHVSSISEVEKLTSCDSLTNQAFYISHITVMSVKILKEKDLIFSPRSAYFIRGVTRNGFHTAVTYRTRATVQPSVRHSP